MKMPRRPRIAFLTVQLEFDGTYPDLLVKAALASAEAHHCDLLVVPGREWGASWEREGVLSSIYRLLPSWPLDAVIVAPPVTNDWSQKDLLHGSRWLAPLPIVTMDVPLKGSPRVELDGGVGLRALLTHLIEAHQRTRIACLRGPLHNTTADERYQAWKQTLEVFGLDCSDELVGEVEFKEEGVAQVLGQILDREPGIDAVVAASDLVALAAIRELRRRGLRVPQDVAVVGYDDLPLSAQTDPPLSTVNSNLPGQVEAAFRLALGQIGNEGTHSVPKIPTTMVLRSSCGCPFSPPSASVPVGSHVDLLRRLERLATFNLGLGHRASEAQFHQWLSDQFPHQGFENAILGLVDDGSEFGQFSPETDPATDLPEAPPQWKFPLDGKGFDTLWGRERRTRVALGLAADHQWFGLLVIDLDADGALVYRGIQEALTRRYRENYERQVLVARTVEEETAKRVEQEKIKALGQLVAGVAHEVNTPLGNAITAASYLEELLSLQSSGELPDESQIAEAARLLRHNLSRAAELVARFKRVSVDLARSDDEMVDVSTFLADLMPTLAFPLRRANIEVSWELQPGLKWMVSTTALFDILTNLSQNTLDHAFPQGGPGQVTIGARERDGKLLLTFRDSGIGMEESVQRRIFEPFFTTRRGQGGSGLGLHIVFNLVTQQMRGTIGVASLPGAGALFTIELPGHFDPNIASQ